MKVAILTNFMEFHPGYSLTGIVKDQVHMLKRHGDSVDLFVNSHYHGEAMPLVDNLKPLIPFAHLKDYRSVRQLLPEHAPIVETTRAMLLEEMPKYDVVFTHDLVFTGWFMPYALAIQAAAPEPGLRSVRWMHWIHSVPSPMYDWWEFRRYGHYHRLIFPNRTDRRRVAEQYRTEERFVQVIPHIKDIRTWFDFHDETNEFINEFPAVLQADTVQILPASVDRLAAKGVGKVILVFAKLKDMGFSVCLVVANQWATGVQQKQDVAHYEKIARRNGLKVGEEVIFTSTFKSPTYDTGIPQYMLRELMQLSNLFIFPTREESFGLVVPEVCLAGGVLPVLNKSLDMQKEISFMTGLYFDFGSYHNEHIVSDEDAYLTDLAKLIVWRMRDQEAVMSKTLMRQRYNMDYMYDKFYGPIMAGAQSW